MVSPEKKQLLQVSAEKYLQCLKSEESKTRIQAAKTDLWLHIYECFLPSAIKDNLNRQRTEQEEKIADVLLLLLEKHIVEQYDPAKEKSFYNYLFSYIVNRGIDWERRNRRDAISTANVRFGHETGESELTTDDAVMAKSINKPVDLEGTVVDEDLSNSMLMQFTRAVADFYVKCGNDARYTSKKIYSKLFFTASVTSFLRLNEISKSIFKQEKSCFSVMELPFLDFYMSKICRRFREIIYTPLKEYSEVVKTQTKKGPIPDDIPDDVFCTYMNVGKSTVSNQRAQYNKLIKEFLC